MTRSIERTEAELGRLGAVWNAFLGKNVNHYPRFYDDKGAEKQILDDEIIDRIASELGKLKEYHNADVEFALMRGRESLDEVKSLTEYEDQKATRNLTIITFLSALAGVLFSYFADNYPLRPSIDNLGTASGQSGLVIAGYVLFFCFIICAVSGALIVFHATRIRFKYPKLTTLTLSENMERTKSYLFYSPIIQVLPERWAQSFLKNAAVTPATKTELNDVLGVSYLRNYIIESYLVAAKVADKLRYLMPAQDILSWSIRLLLVWLFILALAVALVPNQSRAPALTAPPSPAVNQTGGMVIEPTSAVPTQQPQKPGG